MPDLICLACPGPGVETHHHPRRSAGEEFRIGTGKMVIPIDDLQRLIPVCRRLHTELHEHRLRLEHTVGGVTFGLDALAEAKGLPDADYILDGESVVWQRLTPPDNLEDALAQLMNGTEQTFELYQPLIRYMSPEQIYSVYNIVYSNTANLRQRLSLQAVLEDFGWRRDGKLFTKTDKVKRIAAKFGVSPRTIWRDLGEDGDNLSSKCPDPNAPGGKHHWPPDERKCLLCGESK